MPEIGHGILFLTLTHCKLSIDKTGGEGDVYIDLVKERQHFVVHIIQQHFLQHGCKLALYQGLG